jgi:hypothetical protein
MGEGIKQASLECDADLRSVMLISTSYGTTAPVPSPISGEGEDGGIIRTNSVQADTIFVESAALDAIYNLSGLFFYLEAI